MADSIGSAEMRRDRSIVLQLRAIGDGVLGDAEFTFRPGDPMHAEIVRHVGGLEPGESKHVPAWK